VTREYLNKPLHQFNFCNSLTNIGQLERHNSHGALALIEDELGLNFGDEVSCGECQHFANDQP
jgi:hypothetical protein